MGGQLVMIHHKLSVLLSSPVAACYNMRYFPVPEMNPLVGDINIELQHS